MNKKIGFPLEKQPLTIDVKKTKPDYLCELPNSSRLKWGLPIRGDKLAAYYRQQDEHLLKNTIATATRQKIKRYQPDVDLWSSKTNMHVICADLDCHPEGYAGFTEELFTTLKNSYTNAAIARSLSGKIKMFFVVELPKYRRMMDTDIALLTLKKIFEKAPHFFKACGHEQNDLRRCFINEDIRLCLKEVKNLVPHPATIPPRRLLNRQEGTIPELLKIFLRGAKKPEAQKEFLRILLATPELIDDNGFCLSQLQLCENINRRHKISRPTITGWIKKLVKDGWLKCINQKFVPEGDTRHAKRYVADNELHDAIDLNTRSRYKLPSEIEDGTWNKEIYRAACHFVRANKSDDTESDDNDCKKYFWDWFYSVPGCLNKNRRSEAEYQLQRAFDYIRMEQRYG